MTNCCERCHYKGVDKTMCNWGEPHKITYDVTENIDSCILFLAESFYNRWTKKQKLSQDKYIKDNKAKILKRIKEGKYGENPEI